MSEEAEIKSLRLQKLASLNQQGIHPYAVERYERTHSTAQVHDQIASLTAVNVSVAGRLVAVRIMGKASFAHLQDQSGRIQLYFKRDILGNASYSQFKDLDLGDIIGIQGRPFLTHTGEPTIEVHRFLLLAKSLRPIPLGKEKDGEQHAALHDVEQRYRHRYLDLIVNPASRDLLLKRIRVVQAMRRFLDELGFLEVETPVLQTVAGGAAARPFTTHHHALNLELHLRISLELYLKRLIIGGFEKVYEIGRVFRNEGISTRHNPEFTLMELYQAYANLEDIMDLVEAMYVEIAKSVNGSATITYQNEVIDLSARPWKRLPMLDGIEQYSDIKPSQLENFEDAVSAAEKVGLPTEGETNTGGIIEKLHERFVQPHLIQPTFITDYPIDTSPLAKRVPDNPKLTRRFEVFVATQELGNAFSEMNDPVEQRERFFYQQQLLASGDPEAHPMDEEFLLALEYGMPPTGGLGVGVDRLAILLSEAQSIRDVILFPLLRPE